MTPDEFRRRSTQQADSASQLQNMLSGPGYYDTPHATATTFTAAQLDPLLRAQQKLARGTITPYLSYVSRGTPVRAAAPRSGAPSLATRWRARLQLLLGRLPRIKLVKK